MSQARTMRVLSRPPGPATALSGLGTERVTSAPVIVTREDFARGQRRRWGLGVWEERQRALGWHYSKWYHCSGCSRATVSRRAA
jgi:hypothetical protein